MSADIPRPSIIDPHHRDSVNWDAVDRWRGFGGIRIEDDVLVGGDGPTILTSAIPIGAVES